MDRGEIREILEPADGKTAVLGILALAIFLVGATQSYSSIENTVVDDNVFFEYTGLMMATEGVMPYEDIWDLKPPMIYLTAASLAVVAGGNPSLLHILSVLLTLGSLLSLSVILGLITYSKTQNKDAALIAGISIFSILEIVQISAKGLRPKIFMLMFGFLSIYLYQKERDILSGTTAALSAGFWHFGAFFFGAIFLLNLFQKKYSKALKFGSGGVATACIVVTPFLILGGFSEMLTQVIISALANNDSFNPVYRMGRFIIELKFSIITFGIGSIGILLNSREELLKEKSDLTGLIFASGLVFYGLQVILIDFDGPPDLFPLMSFTAFGVGIVYHKLEGRLKDVLMITVIFLVATSVIFGGAYNVMYRSGELDSTSMEKGERPLIYGSAIETGKLLGIEVEKHISNREVNRSPEKGFDPAYYTEGKKPEYCHFKMDMQEKQWMEKLNLTRNECIGVLEAVRSLGKAEN